MNQIVNGLNSKDGVYLTIGTQAFRTTDEAGKIIRCKIGKGSNPWKYNYFTTREAGYKSLGVETVVLETKTKVKEDDNYDKEALLKVNPSSGGYGWHSYGVYGRKETSFIEREKYLDSLTKITLNNKYFKIIDLSDLFFHLIIKRISTSNCDSGRARTADDLYLLAKYQFGIDITFEECYKILVLVRDKRAEFHPNFGLSMSWCTTVNRIVTGPNFPSNLTKEDFRVFFNKLKVNKNVVKDG